MAMWLFTEAILAGRSIDVFNHGRMQRDFTFIDDIVEGVVRTNDLIPRPSDPQALETMATAAPWAVYNIGNNQPVQLLRLIETLEQAIGRVAEKRFLPMQPGDVESTCADIQALQAATGFRPDTPIEVGVRKFVDWYRSYHGSPR